MLNKYSSSALTKKFTELKRRSTEKENRLKVEQEREHLKSSLQIETLQEKLQKVCDDKALATEKISFLEGRIATLQANIEGLSLSSKFNSVVVEERNHALQISEICLMEHEDRLSREEANRFISAAQRAAGSKAKRRSSLLVRSEVFFDKDYKSVEIGLKSDRKWEFVQERILHEKERIAKFSSEYREETERIKIEMANFEKMFGIVANLMITQMNNPLTLLPHQVKSKSNSAHDAEDAALRQKLDATGKLIAKNVLSLIPLKNKNYFIMSLLF